ncbi:MAG: hypothetical protein CL623_07275 [Arcobacter sp.]|nr:hypothetical protein [Arcobacter sp.]|tara:strand:+ start:1963 stop:2967 length:1005 start_codon:yes stop_codon:yes gene_type:complete
MNNSFEFNPYEALKSIIQITSVHTGNDFIKVTAEEIKKLFKADLVYICKSLNFNPTTFVEILYATETGLPKQAELVGNPCQLVYKNSIVKINKEVRDTFKSIRETNFQSYYGVPITNDKNECIGHIAIYSNKARELPTELDDIAVIYARKIEVETKRLALEVENVRIRKELETLAISDNLTNLYNRRHFQKMSNDIFAQVKRDIVIATLSYLDLDDFKLINDSHGHDGGDIVLKDFSKILIKESREGMDYLFRVGGEEFCIISLNTSLDYSVKHLERIMTSTSNFFSKTKFNKITLSIGIVEFNKKFDNYNQIITLADKKMYKAKKLGKNNIVM